MDFPNHPSLLLMAIWPILVPLAAAAAFYRWQRSVGSIVATLFSLGVALLTAFLVVFVTHISSTFYGLADSAFVLLGIPLVVYAATLAVLTYQASIPLPAAIGAGLAGLGGLWFAGGAVLISTVCSFNNGGC